MTGLSSIFSAGLSGMFAAQSAMKVTSQNIANANTPGYVRTDITLLPSSNAGVGAGVDVGAVRRAADRFLDTAGYIAQAAQGAASARSDILARAQAEFGDPTGDTSMFATLDSFWSALQQIGVDPASTLRRDDAVSSLQTTFGEVQRVGSAIQSLIGEADQRISDAVASTQSLLERISSLNDEIRLSKRTGADTSSAENAQSALIDDLSKIIDVRVEPLQEGGVHIRTSGGALLVGAQAAQLSYTSNSAPFATHGVISLNPDLGTQSNIEPFLVGGELKGLLQVRDEDLPALAESLGGFAAALGDSLNEVHNENTSSPAVQSLTGRDTGLLATDSLNFTGKAIVGVTDASGNLTQRLTIDFDNSTVTAEPPGTGPFNYSSNNTIGGLTAALNAALAGGSPAGSASFTGGVLKLSAGAAGGILVQQDANAPADRAGRGFSHFFGLNDLVSRPTPLFFENGISGGDKLGLNAGGAMTFQITDSSGRFIAQRTLTINATNGLSAGTATWNNLVTSLNATGTGVGEYGSFAIDSTTGQMKFTQAAGFAVTLVSDSTSRGATGISVSALHGLGAPATAGRALEVDVNTQIAGDPTRLAVGRPDLTGTSLNTRLIEAGDNRGVAALANSKDAQRTFAAAGLLAAQTTTLALYAARLGGEAGRISADAKRDSDGATAVATAAQDRRDQIEGVNLDDELLKMTTYQKSYAASARVIQAATEMLDILLSVGLSR